MPGSDFNSKGKKRDGTEGGGACRAPSLFLNLLCEYRMSLKPILSRTQSQTSSVAEISYALINLPVTVFKENGAFKTQTKPTD